MTTSTNQHLFRTRLWIGLGGFLLFLAGSVFGQESDPPTCPSTATGQCTQERGVDAPANGARLLRPVQPRTIDFDGWRARLTAADIDAREEAFDEFVGLARSQRQLRTALESWSVDPTAPELAWTARLALRQLAATPRQAQPSPGGVRWVYLGGLSGLEQSVPVDERRGESSAVELRSRPEETGDGSVSVRLRQIDLPLPEPLAARRAVSLCVPRRVVMPPPSLRVRTFAFDVQPEGVTLVVREQDARGSRVVSKYAAASLDALLAEHAELRDQVPGLSSFMLKPFGPGSSFVWPQGSPMFRLGQPSMNETPTSPTRPDCANCAMAHGRRTNVLGVKCTPLASEETTSRCLGPGVGLLIEFRESGTIADALGLRRGDILVELCGQPLCGVDEISQVMAERPGDEVVVKIVDATGRERTSTWLPCLELHRGDAEKE